MAASVIDQLLNGINHMSKQLSLTIIKQKNICKCGKPGSEPSECPYDKELSKKEINPDDYCNCCPNCREQCYLDI